MSGPGLAERLRDGTVLGAEGYVFEFEALGREVPAGKYSPAMELHPMYRAAVTAKDASFAALWNATPAG
jgi:hypothetical protein